MKTIFDNFAARMWHIPSTLSFTLAKNLELRHLHEVFFGKKLAEIEDINQTHERGLIKIIYEKNPGGA